MDPLVRLKEGQKWMWGLGDYAEVSPRLEPCSSRLAALAAVAPGLNVLDVAAGNGNFALAAAARGARVTASDLTPRMIELGQARSAEAGATILWTEADAESLPFDDAEFDVVASVFGAIFAPRPELVARELFRVCRPGGTVAMANWAWNGYLGAAARLLAEFSGPGPDGVPSPFEWGEEQVVRERFAGLASSVVFEPGDATFEFESIDDAIGFFERTNAPVIALKTMQTPERYADFRAKSVAMMEASSEAEGGRIALRSSYMNVVARK